MAAANSNRANEWCGANLTRCVWRAINGRAGPTRNQKPVEIRRANLWAKYRITPEEYDALRAKQDFRCGICGIDETDVDLNRVGGRPRTDGQPLLKVALAVDHDHITGSIRGLLCASCNAGLGAFGDDRIRLRAAIAYLNVVRSPEHERDVSIAGKTVHATVDEFPESIVGDRVGERSCERP